MEGKITDCRSLCTIKTDKWMVIGGMGWVDRMGWVRWMGGMNEWWGEIGG